MMLNRSGATSVIRTVCWMFLCSTRFGVTDGLNCSMYRHTQLTHQILPIKSLTYLPELPTLWYRAPDGKRAVTP
jgi:hypothetical protein